MDLLTEITPWFEHGSYLAVFIVLVLCGIGLPIPEEITFIAAGIVTQDIGASVWVMIAVALVGILAGDTLTYVVGRRYGMLVLSRWPFNRFLKGDNLEKARRFIDRHGAHAVFFAGFLAGVRAPTYFLCGSMGLSYPRFILWDLCRAALTCPISVWLAWHFGADAKRILSQYSHVLFSLLAVAFLILVYRFLRRRRKNKLAHVQAAATQTSPDVANTPPQALTGTPPVKETSGT